MAERKMIFRSLEKTRKPGATNNQSCKNAKSNVVKTYYIILYLDYLAAQAKSQLSSVASKTIEKSVFSYFTQTFNYALLIRFKTICTI